MVDQKPISPESQEQAAAEIKKLESERPGAEIAERLVDSRTEKERLADEIEAKRQNLTAAAQSAGQQINPAAAGASIEEKKQAIIDKLAKEVIASGFSETVVEQVMKKADTYLQKGFPDLADALHDRITEEKRRSLPS